MAPPNDENKCSMKYFSITSSDSLNKAPISKTGMDLMKDPLMYNSTSTPIDQRHSLGIKGLIPAGHVPLKLQVERCIKQMRSKCTLLDKYLYLQSIQDINERLYYAILIKHTAEVMPIVYTPTVGEACQKFSSIFRGSLRGLYLTIDDLGSIRHILDSWPFSNVTTIVCTDGERILGLGDLGVNGILIPIGKLALYTACAGIPPANVLPVHIDVGTNNENHLVDPYYLGLRRRRERGRKYDELVEEFFEAAQEKFGKNVLIQFEDFGNTNAFRLLNKFRLKSCTFNDDIQGTASVALAGIIASSRITGVDLSDHTFLFQGAGEAGTGIADLIAYAVSRETGKTLEEARKKIFLVDSNGLVTFARIEKLQHHKLYYAHEVDEPCADFLSALRKIRPTAIIGVSAVPKVFTKTVCEEMAQNNEHPLIFALSNPTHKAECTAQEAYEWTDGGAVFCSGSPFDAVTLKDGRKFVPGQGNNAYIFPGVGLGALAAGSTRITNHDMLLAAKCLAGQVSPEQLKTGSVYPALSEIREVSAKIAAAIANNAYETGVATKTPKPDDMLAYCKSIMYDPFEM